MAHLEYTAVVQRRWSLRTKSAKYKKQPHTLQQRPQTHGVHARLHTRKTTTTTKPETFPFFLLFPRRPRWPPEANNTEIVLQQHTTPPPPTAPTAFPSPARPYLDVCPPSEHAEGDGVGTIVDGSADLPKAANHPSGGVVGLRVVARLQAVVDGEPVGRQTEQLHLPEHVQHQVLHARNVFRRGSSGGGGPTIDRMLSEQLSCVVVDGG